jgi:hypothetical protein
MVRVHFGLGETLEREIVLQKNLRTYDNVNKSTCHDRNDRKPDAYWKQNWRFNKVNNIIFFRVWKYVVINTWFYRLSISNVCGHSSVAVKNFYLLEDRKADVQAVETFTDILGSNYGSCNTSPISSQSPSTVILGSSNGSCNTSPISSQSSSYASMDPTKKTRLYYYFIYIYSR